MASMVTKGEKTRAEIVDCARKLFYEHGYDGTSFSRIVDESGLFRGNIYHYFKTKDQILWAVVERYLVDYETMLSRWEHQHPAPRERLHAFVDMIVARKADLVKFGCPIGSLNTELGKDRHELQRAARKLFDLFRNWLAECFRALGCVEEADALALHLLGRAQGIVVMSHVYQDKQLLAREVRELKSWIDQR